MPSELTPSQPVTENREMVTVTYMTETEKQNPSDSVVPDEAVEATVTSGHHPQAEVAALSSVDLLVDATVGVGAGKEKEEMETERFITLTELTSNRLSESGEHYCILASQPPSPPPIA